MAFPIYLAMTGAELSAASGNPYGCGVMACCFSSRNSGIGHLPEALPDDSVLLLNDRIPYDGHEIFLIGSQLAQYCERENPKAVLLDFQRPYTPCLQELTTHLRACLSVPVVSPPSYCDNGAVFLPPVPTNKSPKKILAPWKGQEIWLELAFLGQQFSVTEAGCSITSLSSPLKNAPFYDHKAFCHYHIEESENGVLFRLHRTQEDYILFLQEAAKMGVCGAIGLFQEYSLCRAHTFK